MIMISSNLFITFTLLLSISLPSYAVPILDSSTNATSLNYLDRRIKIGGAKPPPKKPVVPAPAPAPVPPPLPPKEDPCEFLQGCSNCVARATCAFSKVTFACKPRTASPDFVTNAVGCPQMNQMQGIFPAVNSRINAGVIPANIVTQFNRVSNHIFNGEADNPTSGRHTTTAWLAANRGNAAVALRTNQVTHIVEFPNGQDVKTAWDSNFYSQLDIKNMCAVAIKLGLGRATAPNAGFVVQSPFGEPACIHFFTQGTGSCFPFGSASPRQTLGEQCSGLGTVTVD